MWPEYKVHRQGWKRWKEGLDWVQIMSGFIGSAQICRHSYKDNEVATNSETKNNNGFFLIRFWGMCITRGKKCPLVKCLGEAKYYYYKSLTIYINIKILNNLTSQTVRKPTELCITPALLNLILIFKNFLLTQNTY